MKLASVRVATVAAVSVCTSHLWGQSANNPIQVALLRWYQANIVTQFSTCTGVNGLAFDGDHVWVACAVDNELEEFNAGDGALVRTVTGVSNPYSLVYDGANIWATGSGTITEVNASTGSIVGTPITVGSQPTGLAFDGQYIWVTNGGSNSLSKVLATTQAVTTYSFNAGVCSSPYGVTFDGVYIWVANWLDNTVTKLIAGTGVVVGTFPPTGQGLALNAPLFVAFDGGNVWLGNKGSSTVSKF
jgi:DNA-binding beta-propeller fold protein YncE